MSVFTQIVILLLVLATMMIVLLGIRQLSHFEGFEDIDETSNLKEEVEDDSRIISRNNIFHNIVDIKDQDKKVKVYKVTSKDPISRKE